MAATNEGSLLKKQLSTAACALLGTVPAAAGSGVEGWEVDTSVLYYQESEGRVSAIEPVLNLRRDIGEKRIANFKLVLDALTGATPNGATPSDTPQTFTRPSGSGSYVVQPGEIPLDDTFHDTRVALNGSWQQPISRFSLLILGANFSKEYDFLSYGANALLNRDFNQRNTTLTLGLSTEFDQIDPEGGIPTPFASMAPAGATQPRKGASDSRTLTDTILGVTQVINRKMLMQWNYSLGLSNGYHTDPFKILSVVDPVTGRPVDYLYEKRPDSRTKHALFWLTRYHLTRDVVSASYRYFFDDWGIKSHTVDVNYHWKMAERNYLEPRIRLYRQSEADFYRLHLVNGEPLPAEASADTRLAQFNGYTVGLKWGHTLKNDHLFLVRLEYYTAVGDSSPGEAIGVQKGLDLYPDLKATIVQVQYSF